jgi:hypothetical protein
MTTILHKQRSCVYLPGKPKCHCQCDTVQRGSRGSQASRRGSSVRLLSRVEHALAAPHAWPLSPHDHRAEGSRTPCVATRACSWGWGVMHQGAGIARRGHAVGDRTGVSSASHFTPSKESWFMKGELQVTSHQVNLPVCATDATCHFLLLIALSPPDGCQWCRCSCCS